MCLAGGKRGQPWRKGNVTRHNLPISADRSEQLKHSVALALFRSYAGPGLASLLIAVASKLLSVLFINSWHVFLTPFCIRKLFTFRPFVLSSVTPQALLVAGVFSMVVYRCTYTASGRFTWWWDVKKNCRVSRGDKKVMGALYIRLRLLLAFLRKRNTEALSYYILAIYWYWTTQLCSMLYTFLSSWMRIYRLLFCAPDF